MKAIPKNNLVQRGILALLGAVLILSLLGAGTPQAVQAARAAVKCVVTYTVKIGDTLASIAAKYDVDVMDIVAANDLKKPYTVSVGQSLCIPASEVKPGSTANCAVKHKVVAGDTLNYLADYYKVNWRDIAEANDLKEPYALTVGQVLCIPGATKPSSSSSSGTTTTQDKAKPTLVVSGGFDVVGLELKNFPRETTYFVRVANLPLAGPSDDSSDDSFVEPVAGPYEKIGRLRTDKNGSFAGYFNLPKYFPNTRKISICLKNVWTDATSCVKYDNPYSKFFWETDLYCRLPRYVLRR